MRVIKEIEGCMYDEMRDEDGDVCKSGVGMIFTRVREDLLY